MKRANRTLHRSINLDGDRADATRRHRPRSHRKGAAGQAPVLRHEPLRPRRGRPAPPAMGRRSASRDPTPASTRRERSTKGRWPSASATASRPRAAYAGDSPILHYDGTTWMGGMFWDGRATGSTLGDPLAEQAQGPFLNPLEQNNASAQAVIDKVAASSYAALFTEVSGTDAFADPNAYEYIGRVHRRLRAFHGSQPVHVQVRLLSERPGQGLTGQENAGPGALFNGQGEVRQLPRAAALHRLHLRQPGHTAGTR